MSEFIVSIVICTHLRFDLLTGAVRSLTEQTASSDSYEVIVVDNDHKPNTEVQKIVSNVSSKISISYLHESKLGLSHARNAGGRFARSDYVGYMDDDAKAYPKYMEILINVLHKHRPDICGGPYYPFYFTPKPKWFTDCYGSGCIYGDEPRYLTPHEYLSGMNIVFRRDLLGEMGWFDPNLGMTGKKLWYGEETMIMINAWKTIPDLKVYYDPELYVYHLVPASKMSVWKGISRSYQKGKSHAYLWIQEPEHQAARLRAPLNFIISVLWLMKRCFAGVIFRDRQTYPFWQNYVTEELNRIIGQIGRQTRLATDFFLSRNANFK